MRRSRAIKLLAVLAGIAVLFDEGCVNHQSGQAVLVADYTPNEPRPASLEFQDDSTADVCGPSWDDSWFKASLTLEMTSRRLRWTIDLHGLPLDHASAVFVDTGQAHFAFHRHDHYAISFDKERFCRKAVEIDLGRATNPLTGEAVLSDVQVAGLLDGRWAIRVDDPAGRHVFLGGVWLPDDYIGLDPLRGTIPFGAEPLDTNLLRRGVLWHDGDIAVTAQVDKRTRTLFFQLLGEVGEPGNVLAVRFGEDGQPGSEAAMAETLEDYGGNYIGRAILTDRQVVALLGQRLRLTFALKDRPGSRLSGLLTLPGYSDHPAPLGEATGLVGFFLYRLMGGTWTPGK